MRYSQHSGGERASSLGSEATNRLCEAVAHRGLQSLGLLLPLVLLRLSHPASLAEHLHLTHTANNHAVRHHVVQTPRPPLPLPLPHHIEKQVQRSGREEGREPPAPLDSTHVKKQTSTPTTIHTHVLTDTATYLQPAAIPGLFLGAPPLLSHLQLAGEFRFPANPAGQGKRMQRFRVTDARLPPPFTLCTT
jgi:hypothetical protein